jgi:hypothetical protein
MPTQTQHNNDTENENTAAISVRNVDREVWRNFRKLAMLHDMTIQDYLKHLVEKEMKHVSISPNSK